MFTRPVYESGGLWRNSDGLWVRPFWCESKYLCSEFIQGMPWGALRWLLRYPCRRRKKNLWWEWNQYKQRMTSDKEAADLHLLNGWHSRCGVLPLPQNRPSYLNLELHCEGHHIWHLTFEIDLTWKLTFTFCYCGINSAHLYFCEPIYYFVLAYNSLISISVIIVG